MSAANVLTEIARAVDQYTPTITGTYTANVGAGHYRDAAIKVVDPAANFTITVPDGLFLGQELIVYFHSDANNISAVTVTANGGTIATLTAAGDYTYLKWMGADWKEIASVES